MPSQRQVRRSVTLPAPVDRQIEALARKRRLSGNRVLVELVELGLEARQENEAAFFDLVKRFRESDDPRETRRLGRQLGRMVFGQ